ncbi:hypothetical protein NAPIS_ORF02430 [Vairimorpha apis BRL 01]|uniref:Uncharacterized protein n=1 Tax=Vairimorpha apis BRL 01 TaxID=1037528 RepID=T0L674_9MICR|nr:hypothetical protein NAPIS_ORF02430 [Vairimorpha apis BRL 01]
MYASNYLLDDQPSFYKIYILDHEQLVLTNMTNRCCYTKITIQRDMITIDHMVTRGEKMLGQDNMRCHNKINKYLLIREKVYEVLQLNFIREKVYEKYNIELSEKRFMRHLTIKQIYEVLQFNFQHIMTKKFIKKRIDTTIKTDNKLNIINLKLKYDLYTIELGLKHKYLLVNDIGLIHGCKTKIIPYVRYKFQTKSSHILITENEKYIKQKAPTGIEPVPIHYE